MKKPAVSKKKIDKKKTDRKSWHKKIAIARAKNPEWRENLSLGKMKAELNPSAIRKARLEKQMHQEDIAKQLNMAKSTFGNIELGRQLVRKSVAHQIAKILSKPVNKLFASSTSSDKMKVIF